MRVAVVGLFVAFTGLFPFATHAAEHVDVALVLATDVSRSVDSDEFELQRKGYADAFSTPRVLVAIRS